MQEREVYDGNGDSDLERDFRAKLTEGPVGATLLGLSLPMMGGIFGAIGFNLRTRYHAGWRAGGNRRYNSRLLIASGLIPRSLLRF